MKTDSKIRVAAVQMPVSADRIKNLETAKNSLEKLKPQAPDFVMLPEMFCCPYETAKFPLYAEQEGGETWQTLSALAREYGLYLIAGSVPERDAQGRIYNTSYVFDRLGRQIGKHRKVHLFDIDVKGGQHFRESETLSAGVGETVFDTEFGRMGVMICFDIRFPELAQRMADAGARVIFVPAAFNRTTGPAHWELLFRARALDNQLYMLGCASAQDPDASYVSWGHSILTDPWGEVVRQLDERAGLLTAELELSYEVSVREQIPLGRLYD